MSRLPEEAKDIQEEFFVPLEEAATYITLVTEGDMSIQKIAEKMKMTSAQVEGIVEELLKRGLVIRSPIASNVIQPLHPRMAITNLFKVHEEEIRRQLKKKRLVADRLSLRLGLVFEKRRARVGF